MFWMIWWWSRWYDDSMIMTRWWYDDDMGCYDDNIVASYVDMMRWGWWRWIATNLQSPHVRTSPAEAGDEPLTKYLNFHKTFDWFSRASMDVDRLRHVKLETPQEISLQWPSNRLFNWPPYRRDSRWLFWNWGIGLSEKKWLWLGSGTLKR